MIVLGKEKQPMASPSGLWWERFYGEDYLRMYTPFLSAERTEEEVAGVIHLLNLPKGRTILDLCCGHGRHALPLAERGYQVTGLDLSERLLQQAEREARNRGIQIRWVQSDMRSIPFPHEFHAVINIFTSFGYFSDEEENMQVLRQVHQTLKPGGFFLLETHYQPKVMRTYSPSGIVRYDDGLIVLEERYIDLFTSRNEVRITMLYPDGRRAEHQQSLRLYTLTELTHMLHNAGLEVQAYYGGLDGSTLSMDSRLVVISQKK